MLTSSLVIGAVSMIFTWLAKLVTLHLQGKKELRAAELRAMNAEAVVTKEAREFDNKGFQFTRRFIAVVLTLCIVAIPFVAPLWYQYLYPIDVLQREAQPSIWFGYNAIESGFWPFTKDSVVTVWREFKGLVITPWHTEMFAWIMGMYFGNRTGTGRL